MSEVKLILNKCVLGSESVKIPSSKSFTHRAIVCAALSSGISRIENPLICEDILATIEACRSFGAKIELKGNVIEIEGIGNNWKKQKSSVKINCRESGSTMRFIIPLCSVLCESSEITGKIGLLNRPIYPIIDALKQLNINIKANGKYPPVHIRKGKPKASVIHIAGNISSQYISGLLFSLPLLDGDSTLIITTDLQSKDYVLMTIDVLKRFGIEIITSSDLRKFTIRGNQNYKAVKCYAVEGDYSASAFWFVAGIFAARSKIIIKGLRHSSLQGDAQILDILKKMGADINFQNGNFIVKKNRLKAIEIDAKNIPDLVPILAVAGTQAYGKTIIKNIERIRIKESDRAKAITSQLKKMGAVIVEKNNSLEIKGPTKLVGSEIDTFNDHRIAMSIAVASLVTEGETVINDPICIKKSYPNYFDDLRKLGVNVVPITSEFGKIVKMTIYGDSHGKKVGVCLEGIPAGIQISRAQIQEEVDKRKSISSLTTPRRETDAVKIVQGIRNNLTTGEKINLEILNKNVNSHSYELIKNTPRPGHADLAVRTKYASVFDYRGGGFASGRMTVCMVAAGSIAKKILVNNGIKIIAFTKQVGNVKMSKNPSFKDLEKNTYKNLARCPDNKVALKMIKKIEETKKKNDSIGGIVECMIIGLPVGLGEPLFNSMESVLSQAMFSIPAIKAVEFGSGFKSVTMSGSKHNDSFHFDENDNIISSSNNAGGILGGITTGMPIIFRIAVKPTASIGSVQNTVSFETCRDAKITVGGRHDPCIVIRVPPVAEAMASISILDLLYRA